MSVENQNIIFEINIVFMKSIENFIWETGNLSWGAKSHLGYKNHVQLWNQNQNFCAKSNSSSEKWKLPLWNQEIYFKNENLIGKSKVFTKYSPNQWIAIFVRSDWLP